MLLVALTVYAKKKERELALISAFTKVFPISMSVLVSQQAVHVKGLKISHLPPP